MLQDWDLNQHDQKIIHFVPNKVFDVHAHLFKISDLNLDNNKFYNKAGDEFGFDVWQRNIIKLRCDIY